MAKGKFPKKVNGHTFHSDTLITHLGYAPEWSEGAAVPPVFLTSTWVFKSAEEAERAFDPSIPARDKPVCYTRMNGPDTEILEERLAVLEEAEASAVFVSGMAAIMTLFFSHLRPGSVILHSEPLYGGTDHNIKKMLLEFGIGSKGFKTVRELSHLLTDWYPTKIKMVFVETPANPTMTCYDIQEIVRLVRSSSSPDALVVVDNTFLGPVGQKPLRHGADLVVHSATKSLGGHGDLTGGVIMGSAENIRKSKSSRGYIGTIMQPFTASLLMQHLNTLTFRVEKQAQNAEDIATYLDMKRDRCAISSVHYPKLFTAGSDQERIFHKQCLNAGHMISFEMSDKEAAFRFLDNLHVIMHAVSLGGMKSLACHPASTTHRCVAEEDRKKYGITDGLVRLAIGTEHVDDLKWDIDQALACANP